MDNNIMKMDGSQAPKTRFGDGKTVKGLVVDPAIAGLEKGGGITREAALSMLMRREMGQLEAVGRGASKALWEIVNDSSVGKSERKMAAEMLLRFEKNMPAENMAMCLLMVGYPKEKEISRLDSPKVDVILKNVLLDGKEEQEVRSRAAISLRDRGFGGFERPDDEACYLFFTNRHSSVPACGLAAVPFLLGRVREDLSFENRTMAAEILGEISDMSDEPYDWREVVKTLRRIAEGREDRGEWKYLKMGAAKAFKRITGVYPSQDRNHSTTGPAED